MQTTQTERFARCVAVSKRVHWDVEKDVIRGRSFDLAHKFLPDGLSRVNQTDFLSVDEKRYLSQIQGRTYAFSVHRVFTSIFQTCNLDKAFPLSGLAARHRSRMEHVTDHCPVSN